MNIHEWFRSNLISGNLHVFSFRNPYVLVSNQQFFDILCKQSWDGINSSLRWMHSCVRFGKVNTWRRDGMFQPRGPYVQRSWHYNNFGTMMLWWKRQRTDIVYTSCQNQKENLDLIAEGKELHAWDGKIRRDQIVCPCRNVRKSQENLLRIYVCKDLQGVTKRMQRYA